MSRRSSKPKPSEDRKSNSNDSDTSSSHQHKVKSSRSTADMSKLSNSLKSLINAPHARPGYCKPPSNIKSIFSELASSATSHEVGTPAFLTISTAACMTMNSPESMSALFEVSTTESKSDPIDTAELMREVGLKCISFNGIPRTINCLGSFHASLPSTVASKLSTTSTRHYSPTTVSSRIASGRSLWDSVYFGFSEKLLSKLAASHPDLPVHIIDAHYGNLLSDPPHPAGVRVGRVLTSLVAVTCLRAQTGVGPQVTSHIFGLRKAYERPETGAGAEGEQPVEGGEWLAGEDGNRWLLETVDRCVQAIGSAQLDAQHAQGGTTFAPGMRAKL